jgi:catechol 2,3-dioxygenase-like lactoylglutathione lyase family enzyme
MIRGVHTMFYSSQPDEFRAFIRDKLGFKGFDVGGGWLIFNLPEADMGCHPSDGDGAPSGTHDISFYCDDIQKTVAELKAKGVEFTGPVSDRGYGFVTHFRVPGGFEVQLYQPRYGKPASGKTAGKKAATTRKRRQAGAKAAATRKRKAAGKKAATTRRASRR